MEPEGRVRTAYALGLMCLLLGSCAEESTAQVFRSGVTKVSIRDGDQYREGNWTLSPENDEQVAFYRDSADIAGMKTWLERQFPGASEYDSYRIVFSPLVAQTSP